MMFTLGVMAILLKGVKNFSGNFHAIAGLYCKPNLRFFPEKFLGHFTKTALIQKVFILFSITVCHIKGIK